MDAQIWVSGGDLIEDVASLWKWLRAERELVGTVHVVQRPPGDGELGGVVDVVAVALGSGGAGVVLAKSLTAWLQTRRPNVAITVKTKAGTVTVEARNVGRDQVLPVLERVLSDGAT
jgi:hypothetical protein